MNMTTIRNPELAELSDNELLARCVPPTSVSELGALSPLERFSVEDNMRSVNPDLMRWTGHKAVSVFRADNGHLEIRSKYYAVPF